MNWKKWQLFERLRNFFNKKMTDAWMEGGNCDSCCPRCKQWESHGNSIKTDPLEDGSEERTCQSCDFVWHTIFTPAGFIQIDTSPKRQEKVIHERSK